MARREREYKLISLLIRTFKILLTLALTTPLLTNPANAVTYGNLVADPAKSAPYVVSIWNSPTNDSRDAEFVCSGTLIAPSVVLTAAHCTTLTSPYFVKVKSISRTDKTPLTSVSGVWTSPRYSPKGYVNDIGLLKLDENFDGIQFPAIANAEAAKQLNKFSKLRLFGWGRDQDKILPELLQTTELSLQDANAAKAYGKNFNVKTMIGAGRLIVEEQVWSGACTGDSGGPLIQRINDIDVLVGIVSWGAINCAEKKPSVFSRVSYYEKDIKAGIKQVEAQSITVNRTAPISLADPNLSGEAKPGQKLICNPGTWKNAVSITTVWVSPVRIFGSNRNEVQVLPTDGGSEFRCDVVASSQSASVRRVLRTSIQGRAALTSSPVIVSAAFNSVKVGSQVRCEGWNWQSPVDSEKVSWFTSASPNPSTPVNGREVGNGKILTLTTDTLRNESGRYLICQVTGTKDGFESNFIASQLLNLPTAPALNQVNVAAGSLLENSNVNCRSSYTGNVEQVKVEWGISQGSNNFMPFPGVQGESIQITKSMIQQGAGRPISCRVTISNISGEVSKISTSYNTFENIPVAPPAYVSSYGSLVAGSTVYCNTGYSYSSSYNSLSYRWGITRSEGNQNLESLLGNGSSLTLTDSHIQQLAGNYLTCVVTANNGAGSANSAASTFVPALPLNLVTPAMPTVNAHTASSTSISTNLAIPQIANFDVAKMNYQITVVGSPDCVNRNVVPGGSVDCAGLAANTTYTAYLTLSAKDGSVSARRSSNFSFTTVALAAAAIRPVFGMVTQNTSGFTVQVTNYDSTFTWSLRLDASCCGGAGVTISNSGLITVTGLTSGNTGTVWVTTSKVGFTATTVTVNGTATAAALYVCGQSCTGSLSQTAMTAYISDKRSVEAASQPGGPITSSTCTGSSCNYGTAPALPVACNTGSTEKTAVVVNVGSQITTVFRYCSAPTDTSAPVIVDAGATYTGYAKIIPTSGIPGTSIAVRFVARDNVGIAFTQARLINPENVVVGVVNGTFQTGSVSDGSYIAYLSTAVSGPQPGNVYQIQTMAQDAAGNASAWFNLGTFTITSPNVDCTLSANSLNSVCTNITGIDIRIVTNDSTALRAEFCAISPSTDVSFKGGSTFYNLEFPTSSTSSTRSSINMPTTSVKNCASGGSFGSAQLLSPPAGALLTIKIDYVNNGVQFSKTLDVRTNGDSTGPVITNLAVSPTSISTGQTITVSMKATDSAGVRGCGATVYNVNGVDVVTNNVSTLNPSTGIYTVDIVMNNSNNPGSYTVRGFCNDNNLNKTTTNEVASFTINGASVSAISSMPVPMTIGINYVDQIVLNGFNFGNLSVSPSNYTWTVRTLNAAGTVVSNIPTGSNQTYITGLSGATTYSVYLIATDSAGQSRSSSPLIVTTLTPADSQVPVISNGVVTVPSPTVAGSLVSTTFTVTDNVGVTNVGTFCSISNDGGNMTIVIASGAAKQATLSSGTLQSGSWSCSFNLPSNLTAGTYGIYAEAIDAAQNWTRRLLLGSINVTAATSLIGSGFATDIQSPVISSAGIAISPSSLFENGQISLSVPITDNVGVNTVTASIALNPNSITSNVNGRTSTSLTLTKSSGTSTSGTWSGATSMNVTGGSSDGYLVPGIYDVTFSATDGAGNTSTFQRSSAFTLGWQAAGATFAWVAAPDCLGCASASTSFDQTYKAGNTLILRARVVAYNQVITAVRYSINTGGWVTNGNFVKQNGTSSDQILDASFPIPNLNAGTYVVNIVAETANGRSAGTSVNIKVG